MSEQQGQPARGQRAPMLVQNRRLGLPERGKIKIGMKGEVRKSQGGKEWQAPKKLDHFIITTMERGQDGNFVPDTELMGAIAQATGQQADHLTEIPVRLLWNDLELNFSSRYAAYNGRTLFCAGNGIQAQRGGQAISCPCERIEPDYKGDGACKINGILSVLIDGASGVGGVWKFRTTAFNSVDSLTGSLTYIKAIAGGQLAGIPLALTVRPKQVTRPDGKQNTIYMVGIEYRGTVDELRDASYAIAYKNAEAKLSIERAEQEALRLLEAPDNGVLPGDDPDDVVPEFYPNEAARAAGIKVDTRTPFELARDNLTACQTLGQLQEAWGRYGSKDYLNDMPKEEIQALEALKEERKKELSPPPGQAGGGASQGAPASPGAQGAPPASTEQPAEDAAPDESGNGAPPEQSGGGNPDGAPAGTTQAKAQIPPFPDLPGTLVDYEAKPESALGAAIVEIKDAWKKLKKSPDSVEALFKRRQQEWGGAFDQAEHNQYPVLKQTVAAVLEAAGLPHAL